MATEFDIGGITWCANASLIEQVDKRVVVSVQGKTQGIERIYGTLASFNQYGTIVLANAVERVIVDNKYAEAKRGVCMLRGESIITIGEVDPEKEKKQLEGLELGDFKELSSIDKERQSRDKRDLLFLGIDD